MDSKIIDKTNIPSFLTDDHISDIENYVSFIVNSEVNLIDWEYRYEANTIFLHITYGAIEKQKLHALGIGDFFSDIGVSKTKELDLISSLFSLKAKED